MKAKQTDLDLGKSLGKKKKVSLEYRTLMAVAELKKLKKEGEKLAKNRKRYYLHRKAKQYGLQVFATRREVLIAGDLDERQAYYVDKLLLLGYNIQEVIS